MGGHGDERNDHDLDKVNNPGQDLLNGDVYGYLIALAKSGAAVSVIGGPPCRTVSACRSRSPGPRPVRSEEHLYGFSNLTNSEKEMVDGDSVLWGRCTSWQRRPREDGNSPRWRMGKNSLGTLGTTGWTF